MKTRQQNYDDYKNSWVKKSESKINSEILSMRKYLEKHRDTFFQESSPNDLTDGLRLMALRDALEEKRLTLSPTPDSEGE